MAMIKRRLGKTTAVAYAMLLLLMAGALCVSDGI